MTRLIKRHRSQIGRVSVVVLTIGALLATYAFALLFVGGVSAAQITTRSDTISDSEHLAADVIHTLVFTTPSAYTHGDVGGATADMRFRVSFPLGTADPYTVNNLAAGDVTVTCTACDSIVPTTMTVVEEDGGGEAAVDDRYVITIDTETGDSNTTVEANAVWTIVLGNAGTPLGVDNPVDDPVATDGATTCTDGVGGVTDADVCPILIEIDEDSGGFAADDSGSVLIAHISDVTVSVTVEESMTFIITGRTEGQCETEWPDLVYASGTVDSATVDFGAVSTPNTFIHACQRVAVTTNASSGYVTTFETDTSLEDGTATFYIDSGTCTGASCSDTADGAWGAAADNGFAVSCDTVTDDDSGSICGGEGGGNWTTEVTNFRRIPCIGGAALCFPENTEPVNIIMDDTNTGDDSVDVNYKLSIGGTQQAAVYSTQVTYITTPTF